MKQTANTLQRLCFADSLQQHQLLFPTIVREQHSGPLAVSPFRSKLRCGTRGGRWCRTEEQQAVGPVEEPVAEVSTGQDSVGAGQLGQEATHLQLEALRLTGTWRQEKKRRTASSVRIATDRESLFSPTSRTSDRASAERLHAALLTRQTWNALLTVGGVDVLLQLAVEAELRDDPGTQLGELGRSGTVLHGRFQGSILQHVALIPAEVT